MGLQKLLMWVGPVSCKLLYRKHRVRSFQIGPLVTISEVVDGGGDNFQLWRVMKMNK